MMFLMFFLWQKSITILDPFWSNTLREGKKGRGRIGILSLIAWSDLGDQLIISICFRDFQIRNQTWQAPSEYRRNNETAVEFAILKDN
jgi:hypothetical protein